MLTIGAVAVVAALAFGAIATGFLHLPGSGSGAPSATVTQTTAAVAPGGPQQSDEGSHTIAGWFTTVTPQLAQTHQLSRTSGVLVAEAFANSPLEKGGVRPNDVIIAIDGVPTRTYEELADKIRLTPIGQQFVLTVDRAGATESHAVTVERCVLREAPRTPGAVPACARWVP